MVWTTWREGGPGRGSPWLKLCFSCCLGSGDWQPVCGRWGRAGLTSDSRGFPGELWARPLRTQLSAWASPLPSLAWVTCPAAGLNASSFWEAQPLCPILMAAMPSFVHSLVHSSSRSLLGVCCVVGLFQAENASLLSQSLPSSAGQGRGYKKQQV